MELVFRIGRWSITFFRIAIEDLEEEDGPAMSVTSATEVAPGFAPPEPYWEDEE
jgi:hypothetical protein